MAGLEWAICDLTGASVADVSRPLEGANVSIALNGARTAELPLAFEDDPANNPAGEVCVPAFGGVPAPLLRGIKCWLDGVPVFAGPIYNPDYDIVPGRRVTANAIDPWMRLQTSYVNNRFDTDFNANPAVGVFQGRVEDQSERIARLMEHASPAAIETAAGIPGHGIIRGDLAVSNDMPAFPWPATGAEIADEIQKVVARDGGVDVELVPLDRLDGVFCRLDTHYPQQGTDRSEEVIFEVGFGFNNATSLRFKPAGDSVRNRWTDQGESVEGYPPLRYQANQIESQQLFGIYQAYEAMTGTSDQDPNGYGYEDLRVIARAGCATHSFPAPNIEITPAQDDGSGWIRDPSTGFITASEGKYGVPPRFGPDIGRGHHFWIGDVITVRVRDMPTLNFEVKVRVTDAKLTQLASGAVLAEITCNPILNPVGVI